MRYVVVEERSAEDLQNKVQAMIDDGWEPLGGLSVATHSAGAWWYFQAMVYHEAAPE